MSGAAPRFALLLVSLSLAIGCGGAAEAPRPPGSASAAPVEPAGQVIVVDRTTPRPRPTSTAQDPVVAQPGGECEPFRNLSDRREGDLHVAVEPPASTSTIAGRMRNHTDGTLTAGSPREWVGPRVPGFLPLHEGTTELHLLEVTPQGFVAAYRDPYGAGSCGLGGALNCRFVVVGYERCGKKLWSHDLAAHVSRPDHLEIQDLRVTEGIVYFNEACQSYAREAGGKCSSLVAFDPALGKVLWRTRPLVSNNRFVVVKNLIVTGYGFTGESDALFLVRRSDGQVLAQTPLKSAHEDMTVDQEGVVTVSVYPGDQAQRYRIDGADGPKPKLVPLGGPILARPRP